uniref:Putative calcyclin-binding protein cacybp n=1 Tax=Ixodes ricinus TaxID=34613 RepID=A0A0K8RIQ2_IXORI
MPKLDEIKEDLAELKSLQESAKRPKVQQILTVEVRKLETELIKERDRLAEQGADQAKPTAPKVLKENTVFTVKITDYAWDQSEKFVKFYITLPVRCTRCPPLTNQSTNGYRFG